MIIDMLVRADGWCARFAHAARFLVVSGMTTYARRLGLFSGTMAVVGGIIGGGIFRTPAVVAERVGSAGLALSAWVLGGVVALIGAFCYGELGQRRPRAGGGYVYLRETWGPLPAFLYGWTLLLVIATGAIAAIAVTFANYALALARLPERLTVPPAVRARGLVAGVVVVYVLANVAYLRVLGSAGLAASIAPAAEVMRALLGPAGGTLIAAGIALSTFGFLNLVILVTPRVLQAMAADGLFFPRLAELHPVYRTPAAAILVQAGWAVVLTVSGTFGQLVDYVAFGDWIFFGLTVAGLFIYRARDRSGGHPAPAAAFRVPGYPWTPWLFVLAAAYVVASSVGANPKNAAIGSGLILLGVPLYYYWRAGRRNARTLRETPRR